VVVAARANARNIIEHGLDETLLREIPESSDVVRSRSYEAAGLYARLHRIGLRKALIELERLVPTLQTNYKIGWYPAGIRAARRLAAAAHPTVVYSSSPPYAGHFVARRLARELHLPWVADFRDAWTQGATYSPPTRLHAWLERRLEEGVLRAADAVIANTPGNRDAILDAFGADPGKVHVLPNGFDPEDFPEVESPSPHDRFVVSCLGNFYQMRDPSRFFRAFRRLVDEAPTVLVRFFGWQARGVCASLESLIPPANRERIERVNHGEAITAMSASAVLLANVPSEEAGHWVPGKLYEYLAARRPVLFIGPANGDAACLLREAGVGTVVPNDEEQVYRVLHELHATWQRGQLRVSPNPEGIGRYSRLRQAERLADILNRVVKRGPQRLER
jgi:glycosyltransferase involved in cell wall biosynthesis